MFKLLSSADFSKVSFSGTISECQKVWIQIRTDKMSVLIWAQTVWKGSQQATESPASKWLTDCFFSLIIYDANGLDLHLGHQNISPKSKQQKSLEKLPGLACKELSTLYRIKETFTHLCLCSVNMIALYSEHHSPVYSQALDVC